MSNEFIFELTGLCTIAFITMGISKSLMPQGLKLMSKAGCVTRNYKGNQVINAMGIAFLPILLLSTAIGLLVFQDYYSTYITYLFAIACIGFAGLLDDLSGDAKTKGIKGHFLSVLHGQPTTGAVKAFIGLISAAVISIGISNKPIDLMLNILNIALFTNAMNLLDLRPGRCTKTFILAAASILLMNLDSPPIFVPLVCALAASVVYLHYDLNEICMLGDTGANIMGITLGYFASIALHTQTKGILLTTLVFLHLAAERTSISAIIARNRLLSYLDGLGRSKV